MHHTSTTAAIDNHEAKQTLIVFLKIGITFLAFFIAFNEWYGLHALAITQAIGFVFFCICFWRLHSSTAHVQAIIHYSLFMFTIIMTALIVFPSAGDTGLYWMPLFPIASFFFAGSRYGAIWSSIWFVVIAIASALIALELLPQIYTWNSWFIGSSETLFFTFFAYFYVKRRERTEQIAILNEKKYHALFDYLPDAVLLSDEQGVFDCNHAALELFDCQSKQQLIEIYPSHISTNENFDNGVSQPSMSQHILHAMTHGENHFEWQYKQCNSQSFTADIKLSRIDIDGKQCLQAIVRDISQIKKTERALIKQKKKAEKANRAKSEFLSVMSHELRTPLHSIIGLLDLIESDYLAMPTEHRNNLTLARNSAYNLRRLINDILDLTKADAGHAEIKVETFDLPPFLQSIATSFSLSYREKDLTLHLNMTDIPKQCSTDPRYLRQILTNLIGNAVKFTEHGSIIIDTHMQNNKLFFSITDTGIGMSQAFLKHIFDPFKQAQGMMKNSRKGTGLGTTIAHRFIHLMGGDIQVASKLNKGSCFTFHIPCKPMSKTCVTRSREIAEATQERIINIMQPSNIQDNNITCKYGTILLAEDDFIAQYIAEKRLTKAGFQVDIANDGEEAWQKFQQQRYQILLTDLRMPHLDGIGLTQRIRQYESDNNQPRLPIIGLSAHVLDDVAKSCLQAGMDDFISKPVNPESILRHVEKLAKANDNEPATSPRPTDA